MLLDKTYQVSVVLEGKVKVGDPTSVTENEDISFLLESMLLNFFFLRRHWDPGTRKLAGGNPKGGRKPTHLSYVNIRIFLINICINAFSVVPWGRWKRMSVGKIQMSDGLVSTHWNPKAVWAECSTLSLAVLVTRVIVWCTHARTHLEWPRTRYY
jgi:hypothetical protein